MIIYKVTPALKPAVTLLLIKGWNSRRNKNKNTQFNKYAQDKDKERLIEIKALMRWDQIKKNYEWERVK